MNSAGPLSHRRRWSQGVVQQVSPAEVTDLGPGYLEPGLLPVDLLAKAYREALSEFGSAALAYGDDQGALPFRAAAARRAGCTEAQVLVTAGTSHALYLIATMFASKEDVVLVERYAYDLGRKILTDRGLRTRAVAMDADGMDPEALHDAIVAERGRVAFVYLNPTFHNPTGIVVPEARRRALLEVAARHGVLVVEDDAYADLTLDGVVPPSMAELAGYEGVIRLRTFSKTIAPGLRLGFLIADPRTVKRLVHHGLFASGGSANHVTSLAVATLLESGDYDRHLAWLRAQLKARRDALVGNLTGPFEFDVPAGGYFLWLRFAEEARVPAEVTVAAGARFGDGPGSAVRLAYSLNSPDRLAAAGRALAGSWIPSLERT
ncbi:enduracididine biosynthesis enzyme MppQ [Amycolatopsis xylanica]|uniref:Enduracididine biosynthesis enzyme MppQ n=1 Tax=Amycolatopsis xylanica TaxID=589385 RepID=A0A1H2UUU9_9PSEU|nr:PLP-dependent aminotransferase family protein [Amycolatopsis xylanica]SDW59364.1 enduracididine biosynthesis enzyme MppQ [Amycolatopsis xylanica]